MVVAVRSDDRTRRLLASLASQTVPRESYEVIVAENGSADLADTDGAYGLVRRAPAPGQQRRRRATPAEAWPGAGSCC